LLARAEGKYDDEEIKKSNEALQLILDEMVDPVSPLADENGKGKMEEWDEVGMRGFSPHS
jgi:hypothetical protein